MFDVNIESAVGVGDLAASVGNTRFRRPRPGPEMAVIGEFTASLQSSESDITATLFREPRVNGCYPDLVLVFWNPIVCAGWPAERAQLRAADVRYVHSLHSSGPLRVDALRTTIGRARGDALVQRLIDARVATVRGSMLRRRPLRDVFAVKRIVSIEAKVADWRRGLTQALLNTWFSSESFLLLPQLPRSAAARRRAAELGVGLLAPGASLQAPSLPARRDVLPRSYGSWLFNEWVWRHRPNHVRDAPTV